MGRWHGFSATAEYCLLVMSTVNIDTLLNLFVSFLFTSLKKGHAHIVFYCGRTVGPVYPKGSDKYLRMIKKQLMKVPYFF